MGIKKRVVTDETGKGILEQLKIMNSRTGRSYILYGFQINENESNPASAVTYLEDAVGMEPAKMDYTNGVFNYGSWKEAFFMPRPCMVKSNGLVDYYLNPDDYTKKADGSASDVGSEAYDGNAMMEWGRNGQQIWYKIDSVNKRFYVSNIQVDGTYHAWSFINNQGVLVDHFYTAIYNGFKDTNNKMRSLSGKAISESLTASAEITACELNNSGTEKLWYTDVFADRILINILLVLMGKSLNTQAVFGRGLDSGAQTAMEAYVTGSLNNKGMFFGYNDGTHGVKVFGMENWWACQWRRTAGLCIKDGTIKYKLTYGTQDGSAATAYNTTGADYIDTTVAPDGTSGGYINKMEFTSLGAMLPKTASGTSTTYYCDGLWFNNSANTYALFGGASAHGAVVGAFFCYLNAPASYATWAVGCALSLKPLA